MTGEISNQILTTRSKPEDLNDMDRGRLRVLYCNILLFVSYLKARNHLGHRCQSFGKWCT